MCVFLLLDLIKGNDTTNRIYICTMERWYTMNYREKYQMWLDSPVIDEATKEELRAIENDEKEIEDRFYKDLEFGTGGLRGIIGAGSNRMNQYTVGKATQGFANYIKKQGKEAMERGVAIAYDSRRCSTDFARDAALVLNANGIKTYIYKELQPTPILSYAVRKLNTVAGIVVTASHNPPEYNGYKVYWEDGAQVTDNRDVEIIEEVQQVVGFESIAKMELEEAKAAGLYNIIGEEVLDDYISQVKSLSVNKKIIEKMGKDLKIVYTPLHGAGNKPVRRVLKELGFENVIVVPEQELPDPNFSTVKYPNPEERESLKLAIDLAQEVDADVVVGTDPDCDRVGVVARNNDGEYVVLTGNQVGALLVDYYLGALKSKGKLPENGIVIKTVVTSELGAEIARHYGVEVLDTLTGFKFICSKIKEYEEAGKGKFVFGYEESYGYLAGDFVRDKDGVIASMLVCEMVAYHKSRGMTLYDALEDIWKRFGYYRDELRPIVLKGKAGMEKIANIMDGLRKDPPLEIAGTKVKAIEDYLLDEELNLPKSNVLKYKLADESWFAIRPSGTEPKLKIYFSVKGEDVQRVDTRTERLIEAVLDRIK